jgi:pimeloyl-ACP methyl ester carboxylesterase
VTVSEGEYPDRFYGLWVAMLAASEMIPERSDRDFLQALLRSLLSQKPPPAPPAALSAPAQRWLKLATAAEGYSDAELAAAIERRLTATVYRDLSPETGASRVRCPVFLIHGSYDDVIPPEESRSLGARLVNAESHVLITPFLTHTHPRTQPLRAGTKAAAAWDMIACLYDFAGVLD